MAIVDTTSIVVYPRIPTSLAAAPNFLQTNACELNSATDDVQVLFQAPISGEIEGVGFRLGDITTGCTLDVRLEGVDLTTGLSDNTLYDTNTNASSVVADTDDNTWKDVTFTGTGTVTKGDFICVRFDVASGTPSALEFSGFQDDGASSMTNPSMVENDGTPALFAAAPNLAIKYQTIGYVPVLGIYPIKAINTTAFNSGSTPDHYANRFSLPYKARISGVWFWADMDEDCDYQLIDSDGTTVLATVTYDKDIFAATVASTVNPAYFPTSVTIEADTNYWIAIVPKSTTNIAVYDFECETADIKAASPFGGADFSLSTAKDPTGTGSWTTSTTKQLVCGLLIDGIDNTTAGGGGQTSHVF